MDGAHDLGGMHGFGPVDRSQTEHWPNDWERDVFKLTLACGMLGQWNIDQSRFARETMEPGEYLRSSYYEHWLHGLEVLLTERNMLTADKSLSAVGREQVPGLLAKGGPTLLETDSSPCYQIRQRIRLHNHHPKTHTRMPRYIRGRVGEIVRYHGAHIFADQHALDGSRVPAHLYAVRFSGEELWGTGCSEPNSSVTVDVFEPYIEGVA